MVTRRNLIATSLVGAATTTMAATPKDVLVIAKQMDDITSFDPQEGFQASGGEIVNNLCEKLVMLGWEHREQQAERGRRQQCGSRGLDDAEQRQTGQAAGRAADGRSEGG